ncbi:MAG: ATP-binding cassette domain-containing protein [Pseudomonadota bacterium]
MIDVVGVTKEYASVTALSDVTFHVDKGDIVGLLGPNGAGKTTLLKILTGYIQPTSGTALIDGINVVNDPFSVHERIGYLPENAPLYPEMSVQGYLKMIADMRGISEEKRKERISEAVYAVGIEDRLTSLIGELSKGYRQRVCLAQAILHKPPVLILDEPTNGLDPTQIFELRGLIRYLAKESTVLISTHILSEVEAVCDRAIIILQGKIKADAKLEELSVTSDAIVSIEKAAVGVVESLKAVEGVKSVKSTGSAGVYVTYRVHSEAGRDLCPQIYELVRKRDWKLSELRRDVKTLESVFSEFARLGGGDRS